MASLKRLDGAHHAPFWAGGYGFERGLPSAEEVALANREVEADPTVHRFEESESAEGGGRCRDRTYDLTRVKRALYR